jgi:hypothetical protein
VGDPEVVQDAQRVGLAGRLDDPRQHQLRERVVTEHVEAQPVEADPQHPPQQGVRLTGDHRGAAQMTGVTIYLTGSARAAGALQRQLALAREHPAIRGRHERGQLRVVVGGPDVPEHHVTAPATLSDLDLRRPRPPRHLPHEHHAGTVTPVRGMSISPPSCH